MFLNNAWYVAAWDHEITRDLAQITVLEKNICVFRTEAGDIVALDDACPHRKLPLSMGRIKGDSVECGYHGLTFDCVGQCVWAPGGRIPSEARVHAYPTHEKYGLVWIWMGNPVLADPEEIFEIENWDDPAWGINRGAAMELDCNYLLMCDNLLDPTHVAWVHGGSFGQAATRDTPLRVKKTEDGVIVHRWMMDVEPAPFYKKVVEFAGNCDRLQHYEVRFPSHVQLRNIRPEDEALSQMMTEDVQHAFEEDRAVLNAVQLGMANKTSPHIDLPIDGGQLRFRRALEAMIAEEALVDAKMQM